MKNFKRENLLFSLCGLNCGLCPMHLNNYCPGCGGGEGNQSCAIAKCSLSHTGVEYCFQCKEFPCEKYETTDKFDSFITYHNQQRDLKKAQQIGIEAYTSEQVEKIEILKFLLVNFNDGRKKSFFCLAINLLELEDIKSVINMLTTIPSPDNISSKDKSNYAVKLFQEIANQRNIILKLNKK